MSDLNELAWAIQRHLADNPQDHRTLSAAVSSGVESGMNQIREDAGKARFAMLGAMALADGKRLGPEMRQTFYDLIAGAIHEQGCAPIERRFLDLAKGDGK